MDYITKFINTANFEALPSGLNKSNPKTLKPELNEFREVGQMSHIRIFLLVFSFFLIPLQTIGGSIMAMQVSSRAFSDQEPIPVKYAMPGAGGNNFSIPLSWSNAPEGTKSFAISIIDPHPVANNWVHWIVINIPPDVTSLEEGASGQKMPQGAEELQNSFGNMGYGGPQPPKGTGEHPYVVTVYSLNTEKLDLDPKAGLSGFEEAIKGKVLDKAEVTGTFEQ